jgi:hypothetical protein
MPIIAICTNQDCGYVCHNRPVPASCPSCKSLTIESCPNPVCNSRIEDIVTDSSHIPNTCPDCQEPLRHPPE